MTSRSMSYLVVACVVSLSGWQAEASDNENALAILPATVRLSGPESRHRLLVQRHSGGEFGSQIEKGLVYESSDATVAVVEDGVVRPVADGNAVIRVRSMTDPKLRAEAKVAVTGMKRKHRWSFRNDVQPVLAKMGCNAGACHGALSGKGGFKLSLRGYDTLRDHLTITRQARGRRIELSDPGRSLVLAKPSGAIPHKGGIRFDVHSLPYRIISQWIAQGASPPRDNDARIVKLRVLPEQTLLAKGDRQQILVQAEFSDGRVEDVTRWAKFNSTNETVAQVAKDGRVEIVGFGEGAVTAWYASKIVIARVTSPFEHKIADKVFDESEQRNFIDKLVLAKLRRLKIEPSPPCDDAEFLRRVYIDCIGTLPTVEEARRFLADKSPRKRDKLIDALLARPEFVDYWTYKWSDLLMLNGALLRPNAIKAYYKWIHGHVEENTPWDEFVRQILTAKGGSFENGATNFYALHQDPENMAENASQAFLGLSIGCAKCHNHPLEKWTNDQYYAYANLFARVRAKGWGGDFRSGEGKRTLYVARKGDLIQPLSGKPLPPTPLDGEPLDLNDPGDRRVHLARWMTAPDNPYFARAVTNRVWHNFFGVGLVESVDDMRASNPASNEELLTATSKYLVDSGFDLRKLMRVMMKSATYQRTSKPLETNRDEHRFYSRYYPRRLMAEVLLDALSQVTDSPTVFDQILYPGADRKKTDFYPKGTRAIQLYDSAVDSYFLKTFGRNQRRITCECERSDEPSMVQVLHFSNGDTLNKKLRAKKNRIGKLLEKKSSHEQIIEEAFLAALSRFPTDREKRELLKVLLESKTPEDQRVALEDLFWGVMSSREFVFNH